MMSAHVVMPARRRWGRGCGEEPGAPSRLTAKTVSRGTAGHNPNELVSRATYQSSRYFQGRPLMDSTPMTIPECAIFVRRWFEKAGQADGPLLPDGWHGGRVREGSFYLRDVTTADDALIMRLSENTALHIDGPLQICLVGSDLVISGYRRVTLRWRHYGGDCSAPTYEKIYDSGAVRFAAPAGVVINM